MRGSCSELQDTGTFHKGYIVKSWQCGVWAEKGKIQKNVFLMDN